MTRLFLDCSIHAGKVINLGGEKAHYLCTVLRCRPDQIIIVTDATGAAYYARITGITKREATLAIADPFHGDNESSIDIILIQGLLKGEKMDLVIQKATELGVTEIAPAATERSQIRQTRKLQRWHKIATEAARQCGRNRIPLIHEPKAFEAVIAVQGIRKGIIFWEKEGLPLSSAIAGIAGSREIVLCIGPEGGFSEKEVQSAKQQGFSAASLGRRILRAETAALAAIAIAQFALGDLSGQQ